MSAGVYRVIHPVTRAMMELSVSGDSVGQVVDLENARVVHMSLGPECRIPMDMNFYCVSD